MALEFFVEDLEMPDFNQDQLEKALTFLVQNENYQSGDINVIFCSDSYLLQMNKSYLNHDYFTDIITFDYVEDKIISGDLFISLDRIKENADKYADNFSQELYRVVIHGVLHLCGYKDKSESEKNEMHVKENQYLKHAGKI
ncbi:MAG: rRNA maturation RNase YbeY [Bacteroidales bacterium]|jgi:probable rRNA maturation factor|nr:rRNA maturation RNase YbeY [Bacteroidales bacterium]